MAGMIPEEKVNEVRQRASIVEVISDFVSLKKAGRNYLGLCPFHSERTPSFTVNEEKGIFHCFGCGAGGNIFNFLMRAQQLTFPEALQEIAKRYGIQLPKRELSEEEKRRRSLKGRLYEINEAAAEFYHQLLCSQSEGEAGRKYLVQRGISEETVREHRLGFAPAAWDSLALFLKRKGIPLNLAENLGLIIPRKDASLSGGPPSYFDRFRRRIIFPIIQEGGQVSGFGGRIIIEEASMNGNPPPPKYMNSPESPLYSKGQTLYGLNLAKGPIREQGGAFIVEGYMDLLSLYQEGIRNVVASLGTALTSAQISLLRKYTGEMFLIFDADESGKKAAQRSLDLFLKEGVSAKVVSLPSGFDPDSFIRQEKKAGFERVVAEALPVVEYLLEQTVRRHPPGTVDGKLRAIRELVPALNWLRDPLEKNLYIERVAGRLGLKEAQIRAQLQGTGKAADDTQEVPRKVTQGPAHEKLLLQFLILHSSFIPRIEEGIGSEGFSDPRYQKLSRELFRLWQTERKFDVHKFLSQIVDEEMKDLISELMLMGESITDPERMVSDCLRKVKLAHVHQEIVQVDAEIRQRSQKEVESPEGGSGLKELLKRKQRLILEQKKWTNDGTVRHPLNAGQ
jgi:DNA primase